MLVNFFFIAVKHIPRPVSLRIQHLCTLLICITAVTHAQVLPFPTVIQEKSQWSWAACAQAILKYYKDTVVTQTDIAKFGANGQNVYTYLSGTYPNENPPKKGINKILENWGCPNSYVSAPITLSSIQSQLKAGHPLIFMIYNENDGTWLFIVCYGAEGNLLHFLDTKMGKKRVPYDAVNNPNQTWTQTLWATKDTTKQYILKVINGSGSGSYPENALIPIIAAKDQASKKFAQWTGDIATVQNPNDSATTLTMPAKPTTVAATYQNAISLFLLAPNGGESWEQLTYHTIKWNSTHPMVVKLDLFKSNVFAMNLGTGLSQNKPFIVTIPNTVTPDTGYTIMVKAVDDSLNFDLSDKPFTIEPSFIIQNSPSIQTFDEFSVSDTAKLVQPLQQHWYQADNDSADWYVWKGLSPSKASTSPQKTGPSEDHTSGNGNYLLIQSSKFTSSSEFIDVISPLYAIEQMSMPSLGFWAHMLCNNGQSSSQLRVDLCLDGTWIDSVFFLKDDHKDQWFYSPITLTNSGYKTLRVRFRANSQISQASDIALDDIALTDRPRFTSSPLTIAKTNVLYSYQISCADNDNDSVNIFAAEPLPNWLKLSKISKKTAFLEGTPLSSNGGIHSIKLGVTDGIIADTQFQTFTIGVDIITQSKFGQTNQQSSSELKITLNPVQRSSTSTAFLLPKDHYKKARLFIKDCMGKTIFEIPSIPSGSSLVRWNLLTTKNHRVPSGTYAVYLVNEYAHGRSKVYTAFLGIQE